MTPTMGNHRHPPALKRRVRAEWRRGDSARDIAARYGLNSSTVNYICSGIRSRKAQLDAQRSTAAAIMSITGYPVSEIAEHLGVSRAAVYEKLKFAGEDSRHPAEIPDDPRWLRARALIARATSTEHLSRIWEIHQDVWTPELTAYGHARMRAVKGARWGDYRPRPKTHTYGALVRAYQQGRLT